MKGPFVGDLPLLFRGHFLLGSLFHCCLLRDCDRIAEIGFILLKQRIDWTMEGLFFGGLFLWLWLSLESHIFFGT